MKWCFNLKKLLIIPNDLDLICELLKFEIFDIYFQDQDKITAQQKSMREAEQERQWKQLQAMRAREQQMGIPDPRMQGKFWTKLNYLNKFYINYKLISTFRSNHAIANFNGYDKRWINESNCKSIAQFSQSIYCANKQRKDFNKSAKSID
jgi:hypothetical protein